MRGRILFGVLALVLAASQPAPAQGTKGFDALSWSINKETSASRPTIEIATNYSERIRCSIQRGTKCT